MRPTDNRFTDREGRVWVVLLDWAAMKRIRSQLGIDLPKIGMDPDELAALVGSPIDLIDVLWCAIQQQARDRGVSDEEFGRVLAGDAILPARDALLAGLIDFFPQPQRGLLAVALEKAYALERKTMGIIAGALESGALAAAIDAKFTTSGSSGSEPPEP